MENGYGGWHAAVYSAPTSGTLGIAAVYAFAKSQPFLAGLVGAIAMVALLLCGAIIAAGRRSSGVAVPAR